MLVLTTTEYLGSLASLARSGASLAFESASIGSLDCKGISDSDGHYLVIHDGLVVVNDGYTDDWLLMAIIVVNHGYNSGP